jgi:hypothetical protein
VKLEGRLKARLNCRLQRFARRKAADSLLFFLLLLVLGFLLRGVEYTAEDIVVTDSKLFERYLTCVKRYCASSQQLKENLY